MSAPVLKPALAHPLNLLMLAGLGVSAAVTGSWIPLAVAALCELGWLGLAKTLPSQRRYFDALGAGEAAQDRQQQEQAVLRTLTEEDRRRFLELDRLRADIGKLVKENPSLSSEMLKEEVPKIDHLIHGFLQTGSMAARAEDFLKSADLDGLEEEVRRQEKIVEKTLDEEARSVAAQNLELMQRRLEKVAEMRRQVRDARGQLNLIENTVRLLRDQIVTMQSPEELRGRLDDLVRTVDAIESTARETESITRHLDVELHQRAT